MTEKLTKKSRVNEKWTYVALRSTLCCSSGSYLVRQLRSSSNFMESVEKKRKRINENVETTGVENEGLPWWTFMREVEEM